MPAVDTVTLRSARLEFTPLKMSNIYKHFEWNNDADLNHLDDEIAHVKETFGEFKERFERMIFHPSPRFRDFEIHTEDGQLIGVAYVVGISPYNRRCMIGVTIGNRNYWGKGYGREALEMLLRYVFEDLGMHRVSAETYEYNPAWKKLVEATGFTLEGTERDYLFRDGRYFAKHDYSMLEDEYRRRLKRAA
jgi:RimJ/RimL family protein N-acetyltransferase